MRRIILVTMMFLLMITLAAAGNKRICNVKLQIQGGFLFPSDSEFKRTYGDYLIYPGIKFNIRVINGFYVFISYDFIYDIGITQGIEDDSKTTQHLTAFGINYQGRFNQGFGYYLLGGVAYIFYKEDAMGDRISDSALGFNSEVGLTYNFGRNWQGLIFAGYTWADDEIEGISIKLGGIKAGVGLGIDF